CGLGHAAEPVSCSVAAVLPRSGIAHYRGSRAQNRCRSTVVAWFGSEEESGSARSSEQLESDPPKESHAATLPRYVCGSPVPDLAVSLDAALAGHRVPGRKTRPDGVPQLL